MTRSKSATPASQDPNFSGLMEADRLIDQGKLQEAAGLLNRLQTQVHGDARIFMVGTRLAEAAGHADGALKAARQAVQLAPDWSPAVISLALLLARQNQFTEAASTARKAVALGPGHLPTLQGAIDVAHRAGFAALALEFLPRAIEAAAPDNAHFKRQMAQDLHSVGKNAESIALFSELLQADEADQVALQGRADAALASGDTAASLADWDRLVALAPGNETYRFNQAVASGKVPASQPASLPRQLFDELAPIYDQHMVRGLRYQLPKKVAELILGKFPDRKFNALDLGCGTGLLGACLGRIDGFLVGVDVSEKMVEQAARHQVYDKFHTVNLLDALQATPSDLYDVLAALDVFIYVGDLGQAIPDAHRITRPGGYVVFSCERALKTEADWLLRPTKRYAHKRSHVEALCRAAGFAEVAVEDTVIRHEGNQPVEGFLVVARKASGTDQETPAKAAAAKKTVAKKKPKAETAAVAEAAEQATQEAGAAEEQAKPKAVRKPRVAKKKEEDGAA